MPRIYNEVVASDLRWVDDDIGPFGEMELVILEKICREGNLPTSLVIKLIDAELSSQGMSRRSSVFARIDKVLREEWRSEEDILNGKAVSLD